MPMKLKIGAVAYELEVQLESGKQTYDLSRLNKNQLAGVRELVVNAWARERGMEELYK